MKPRDYKCEAKTVGQQYTCSRCNYTWDMNDPEPPKCKTDRQIRIERGREQCNKLRELLK